MFINIVYKAMITVYWGTMFYGICQPVFFSFDLTAWPVLLIVIAGNPWDNEQWITLATQMVVATIKVMVLSRILSSKFSKNDLGITLVDMYILCSGNLSQIIASRPISPDLSTIQRGKGYYIYFYRTHFDILHRRPIRQYSKVRPNIGGRVQCGN